MLRVGPIIYVFSTLDHALNYSFSNYFAPSPVLREPFRGTGVKLGKVVLPVLKTVAIMLRIFYFTPYSENG